MGVVRKLLIPLGILLIMGQPSMALAAQAVTIEKVALGNEVKVKRNGAVIRLKEKDQLQSGDELSTDAQTAVDVRLEDQTLIRVGVSSTYKVEESSKFLALIHRLITGVVRIQVPKNESKNAEIKFRLYTPEGTIGVRGTEFVVIRSAEGTELKGLDGEVVFGPAETDFAAAEKFVVVKRGFHSRVKAGQASTKPEKFELLDYLQHINGAKGPFGPLSGRKAESKTYARKDSSGASKPVAQGPLGAAPEKKDEKYNLVGKRDEGVVHVDWQRRLINGLIDSKASQVQEALSHGADPNLTEEKSGLTPLQIAVQLAEKKDREILIALVVAGANPDKMNKEGETPLMYIADHGLDLEYAKALVDSGADIEIKDKVGYTAADIAKEKDYKELEQYLRSDEAQKDMEEGQAARLKREKEKEKAMKKGK